MTLRIIGAGMAGLLAANILRRYDPIIMEQSPGLPNNHSALLRFRTDEVSKALKIPFRNVEVRKAIFYDGKLTSESNLKFSNLYSAKVAGVVMPRSIMNLDPVQRWIAPATLIQDMSRNIKIIFNSKVQCADDLLKLGEDPIVSTMPMYELARILHEEDKVPTMLGLPIWVASGEIEHPNTDVFQTIYFPEHRFPYYRASITGNRIIVESNDPVAESEDNSNYNSPENFLECFLKEFFGIHAQLKKGTAVQRCQSNGKIKPIDDLTRKAYILELTDFHQIYSLGRFATWRQILMDDLVKDIDCIDLFISQRSRYQRRLV